MQRHSLKFLDHLNEQQYNTKGIGCFGLAHMAMRAMLINDLVSFKQRNFILMNTTTAALAHKIKLARTKVQSKQELSADEHLLLDIPAFFEGAVLTDEVYMHPHLFSSSDIFPNKQDANPALQLTNSPGLDKRGGLEIAHKISGLYQQQSHELEIYFETLAQTLLQPGHHCALVLTSGLHAISVGYDKGWIFFNPYTLELKEAQTSFELAASVLKAFSTNKTAIFSTAFWTTKNQCTSLQISIQHCLQNPNLQSIHQVSPLKANTTDSHHTSWLYVAAQSNDVEKIPALLVATKKPHTLLSDGSSALSVALQNDHQKIAAQLSKSRQKFSTTIAPHRIGYGTAEHEEIGNSVTLYDIDNTPIKMLDIYKIQNNNLIQPYENLQQVSFGQLVGLPDYYALRNGAISDYLDEKQSDQNRIDNFVQSFNELCTPKNLEKKVHEIDNIAHQHDNEYVETIKDVACCGIVFLKLLEENYDHFAPDAWFAYHAGHQQAMKFAQISFEHYKNLNFIEAKKYLHIAYALDGYACHFATDNFSAGHTRTPRRALVKKFGSFLGGALSNSMHDEDSLSGIEVKNGRGDQWTCFGDGQLNDPRNSKNKEIMISLVSNSVNEIYEVFKTGKLISSNNMAARQILPKAVDDASPVLEKPYQLDNNQNPEHMPLFKEINGTLYTRKKLGTIDSSTYQKLHKLHAIIEELHLRFPHHFKASTKAPLLHSADPSIKQYVTHIAKTVDTLSSYSSTSAFFRGARDSKKISLQLQVELCSAKNKNELFAAINKLISIHLSATKFMGKLRVFTKEYLDNNQIQTAMETQQDLLRYFNHASYLSNGFAVIQENKESKRESQPTLKKAF